MPLNPAMTPDSAPNVQQLLAFYLEAGVDCALTEEPVNRLSDPDIVPAVAKPHFAAPPLQRSGRSGRDPGRAAKPPPAPEAAIQSAREAARTAPSLEVLRALLEKFDGCALKFTATRLVFADGNPQARIMFVGEAPGREEDIEGLPFVGRSGKLLDRMIAAIGLDRSQRLHRQRHSMAAARQPHADAAGDANLPAVHPAANRTGKSGRAGDARQSLDPDLAVDPRGHHENPRALVRLRHRHPRDPRARHFPSGLSVALAVLQAHGVAGFALDREGAGAGKLPHPDEHSSACARRMGHDLDGSRRRLRASSP